MSEKGAVPLIHWEKGKAPTSGEKSEWFRTGSLSFKCAVYLCFYTMLLLLMLTDLVALCNIISYTFPSTYMSVHCLNYNFFVWPVKCPPPVRLLAHSRDWLNLAQSRTTKCWRQTAAGTIDQSLQGRGVSPAIYSTVEHRAGLVWRTSPLSGQITRSLQGFWYNMSKEVSVASGVPYTYICIYKCSLHVCFVNKKGRS